VPCHVAEKAVIHWDGHGYGVPGGQPRQALMRWTTTPRLGGGAGGAEAVSYATPRRQRRVCPLTVCKLSQDVGMPYVYGSSQA